MQAENEYGEIIACEREQTEISEDKLCYGLCSRSYLHRVERGERSCEKILADALLQRMGVSSDKFSYILNVQEQDIIILKEKIVDAVDENREEAYHLIAEYKKQTERKNALYRQFAMLAESILEWKNGGEAEVLKEKVLEAWNLTRRGKPIQKLKEQYLSYFEIALSMFYVRLLDEGERRDEAIAGYHELLAYLETHVDVQDRIKWYPQVSCKLVNLLERNGDHRKAIIICEQALKLLRNQAGLFYLPELLEIYKGLLEKRYQSELEKMPQEIKKRLLNINCIRSSLDWLYKKYEIKQTQWIWDISFGMSELYLCQDVIRGRRLGMGLSQEELAEGICDPVTISRIECGKNYPKRKILVQLLQKVKWSGENSTLTAQIGRPEYHRVTSEISMLTHLGKSAEAEKLLEELNQKVKVKNVYAKQYFLSLLSTERYSLGKIDAKTHYETVKEAFHLTVPEMDYEGLKKWNFSRAEAMCINKMTYSCEKVGQEKHVLQLLYILKLFYERQQFQMRYFRAGYELTMRNIGNLLGNMKEYEAAMEASDVCIKLALSLRQGGNAAIALYDKGWDMEQLWETGRYAKKESLTYVKASYALNLFFDRKIQYEFIERHIQQIYGINCYS